MLRNFNPGVAMMNENTITVFIKSIIKETSQVKRFILSPMNEFILPAFSGGSHITTYIDDANGLIVRPYSLINHPNENDSYQIAIRLSEISKGGSIHWHQKVKVGDKLKISYPKNHFPLSFKAKRHVFYAAGIGITPFLSMMAELKDRGETFELHYASKSKELCVFYRYLKESYPEQSRFYFSNEHTRLSENLLQKHLIGTHVYFCGPDQFISNFSKAAINLGYPKSSIHFERFTPSKPSNVSSFQVKLTSGPTFIVSKEQTLLEALLENGLKAPFSCRVGRCGTCELRVAEGEIEHYDHFLTEEQRNQSQSILTCVSRAKSDKLIIDF
jgi:dimethylamine monooxygenase subunit B